MNDGVRYVFILIGGAEVVTGVVGNWLLLAVLLRRGSLRVREVHNLFLANMALADLLSSWYWATFFALHLFLRTYELCIANGFIICTCSTVSLMSLTGVSLNRYLNVCHPDRFWKLVTVQRTVVTCILLWVIGLLLSLSLLFLEGMYFFSPPSNICVVGRHTDSHINVITMSCVYAAPLCLVGFWNITAINRLQQNTTTHITSRVNCLPTYLITAWERWWERWRSNCRNGETCSLEMESTRREHIVHGSLVQQCHNDTRNSTEDPTRPETFVLRDLSKMEGPCLQRTLPTEEAPDVENSVGLKTPHLKLYRIAQRQPISLSCAKGGNPTGTNAHQDDPEESDLHFKPRERNENSKETAFVRSLFVVFILTAVTFLSLFIIAVVKMHAPVSSEVRVISDLFLFFPSSAKWIVLGWMNLSLRRMYSSYIRQKCCACTRSSSVKIMMSTIKQRFRTQNDNMNVGVIEFEHHEEPTDE